MINNNSQPIRQAQGENGFAMFIIIPIVAVVLVLGGVVYYVKQSGTQEDTMAQEKAVMEKEAMEQKEKDAMMEKEGETVMEKEDGTMMEKYTGTVLAGTSAPLLDYNKADYDAAIASDKLVVLYFYANWCPICREEFPKMQSAFNELTTDRVIAFRVNYNDNETDADEVALAREFGVAYQHTKVFLKNGVRVGKFPDSWSKEKYLSEINKFLSQ